MCECLHFGLRGLMLDTVVWNFGFFLVAFTSLPKVPFCSLPRLPFCTNACLAKRVFFSISVLRFLNFTEIPWIPFFVLLSFFSILPLRSVVRYLSCRSHPCENEGEQEDRKRFYLCLRDCRHIGNLFLSRIAIHDPVLGRHQGKKGMPKSSFYLLLISRSSGVNTSAERPTGHPNSKRCVRWDLMVAEGTSSLLCQLTRRPGGDAHP